MSNHTQIEKFAIVVGDLLDNIKIIIGDLYSTGGTTLTPDLIDAVKTYILSKDKVYIIDRFIDSSYEFWENIHHKDEKFFINNSDQIFGNGDSNINAFKVIFTNNSVDDETKDFLWSCIFSMVKISTRYVFECRGTSVEKTNKDNKILVKLTYKNKEFKSEVDLSKHNKLWNIKLW